MIAIYTHAVLELIERGVDIERVLRGLKETLARHGHERLYHTILRRVLRRLRTHTTDPRIIVARAAAVETHNDAITADCETCNTRVPDRVVVDPTLTGGYVLEAGGSRIDRSYKRALTSLYESITQS